MRHTHTHTHTHTFTNKTHTPLAPLNVQVLGALNNATRVFLNDVSRKINEITSSADGISFADIAPYATGERTKRMWRESGDYNDSMWSCGQSVGLINDVPTCKVLIERMVAEAERQLSLGVKCIVPTTAKL